MGVPIVAPIAKAAGSAAGWKSAAAAVGSTLGTGLFGWIGAKRQRKFQREMASTAYQRDMEMWERTNAYNSPAAQMQRLKDAGLNPNLIYGTGASGATGQASSSMPKYQSTQTPTYTMQIPDMLNVLSQYQNIRHQGLKNEEQSTINAFLGDKLTQEQGLRFIKGQKGYYDIGLGDSKVSDSPYSRKFQADIHNKLINNAIQKILLKGFETLPPHFRSILPLLQTIIK